MFPCTIFNWNTFFNCFVLFFFFAGRDDDTLGWKGTSFSFSIKPLASNRNCANKTNTLQLLPLSRIESNRIEGSRDLARCPPWRPTSTRRRRPPPPARDPPRPARPHPPPASPTSASRSRSGTPSRSGHGVRTRAHPSTLDFLPVDWNLDPI